MVHIPKRLYVPIDEETAILLAGLARKQEGELTDPRRLAAKYLAEKVQCEVDCYDRQRREAEARQMPVGVVSP